MLQRQKKIIIVEDDEDISAMLKSFLEGEGYEAETAENGQKALELIGKRGLPHLILLDMKMPIMNGWQFADKFRVQHDHLTPIVVMTAAGDAEQRARDIDASGWIGKPFGLEDLLSTIRKYEKPGNAGMSAQKATG
ncbi:MAG: response regulator [Bdellovibrionota bacterium]